MPNRRLALAVVLVPLAAALPAPARAQAADLIVTNARIYAVDENRPLVDAMAMRGGRVIPTGAQLWILTLPGPNTQVLDMPTRIDGRVTLVQKPVQ